MPRYLFTVEISTHRKTKGRFAIRIGVNPAILTGVGFLLFDPSLSLSHLAAIALLTAVGVDTAPESDWDGPSDGSGSDH